MRCMMKLTLTFLKMPHAVYGGDGALHLGGAVRAVEVFEGESLFHFRISFFGLHTARTVRAYGTAEP